MFNIIPIPALSDNYIWLIIHTPRAECLLVDPGEADPALQEIAARSLTLVGILLTHHHADHTAGVAGIVKHHPVPVYGPGIENIPTVTHPLSGGETIHLPGWESPWQALPIPGHTRGHLAYYTPGHVFCGDTLFTLGCGRVFEGTFEQMYTSLERLNALPPDTQVYCGHEYTAKNADFALEVEPNNQELQQRKKDTLALRHQGRPTVPSRLALEHATNPFLRCHEPTVRQAAEHHHGAPLTRPEEVFRVLRTWKDGFG